MKHFRIELRGSGTGMCVIRFIGEMVANDNSLFEAEISPTDELLVDLAGLQALNSIGVREFLRWSALLLNPKITFVNCPKSFIDQVNQQNQFIPAQAKILSFYAPYYSVETGEEEMILFEKEFAFSIRDGRWELSPPQVKDSQGNLMKLDVLPEKYFKFLSKHG